MLIDCEAPNIQRLLLSKADPIGFCKTFVDATTEEKNNEG